MTTSDALLVGLVLTVTVTVLGLALGLRAHRSVRRTLGLITAEHHALSAQRANLEANLEQLRRQLATVQGERDRLDAAYHDLHDSFARAVDSRDDHQRRADEAGARLADADEALTRLQHHLQATREELLKAITRNDSLSNELTAARAQQPGWVDPEERERSA